MPFIPRLKARLLLLIARRPDADPAKTERAVLYAVYGSDIIARLARIHGHAERDGPDGTLVVALRGRTPGYVRCAFEANGATLICEARAGVYPPPRTTPPRAIAEATAAALKKAGYWPDQAGGRFLFRYEIDPEPDTDVWGGASVTILNPLIEVFGARATSNIEIIAPLAPKRDETAIRQTLGEGA